jgi:hypothetical protein
MSEELYVAGPEPASGRPAFRYNEVNTLNARLIDLADRQRAQVPSAIQYQSLAVGRSWEVPGEIPAMAMSVAHGRSGAGLGALPSDWLTLTGNYHPQVLKDPLGALQPAR